VSIEIRQEEVHEAIVHSMEQNQAYLLVLGAQGHSFVERMTMGSVSMHEVIYGRHPVLVIRD
jgi:nucleotide-binding universal stress UspA family protein